MIGLVGMHFELWNVRLTSHPYGPGESTYCYNYGNGDSAIGVTISSAIIFARVPYPHLVMRQLLTE